MGQSLSVAVAIELSCRREFKRSAARRSAVCFRESRRCDRSDCGEHRALSCRNALVVPICDLVTFPECGGHSPRMSSGRLPWTVPRPS
jgi:hypothetical protein